MNAYPIKHLLSLMIMLGSCSHVCAGEPAGHRIPELRVIWCWSAPDEDPDAKIAKVKELGFNAFVPDLPGREAALLAACRKAGISCYMPVYGDVHNSFIRVNIKGAEQVMLPAEKQALSEQQKSPELKAKYQFGGEPIFDGEIYWNRMLCPNHPDTEAVVKAQIDKAIEAGFDGIAFDYFGYQNYRGCYCGVCAEKFDEYTKGCPDLEEDEAFTRFAEDSLVSLVNKSADYARSKKPGIRTTCHIYPHFAPNPFYGNRLALDYCGVTAAWFFDPHWSEEKIRRYADRIVKEQAAFNKSAVGAPFIGVYTDKTGRPYRKNAARVAMELGIAVESGAKAIQMAELGHLLADKEIYEVIRGFFLASQSDTP